MTEAVARNDVGDKPAVVPERDALADIDRLSLLCAAPERVGDLSAKPDCLPSLTLIGTERPGSDRTLLTASPEALLATQSRPVQAADGRSLRNDANDRLYTVRMPDGTTLTLGANDQLKTSLKRDGFRMERQVDPAAGQTSDTHSGPRPSDRLILTQRQDGALHVTDLAGANRQEFRNSEVIAPERQRLLALAGAAISDQHVLSRFKADMVRFESRSSSANLPAAEVSEFYRHVARLLDKPAGSPTVFSPENMRTLAVQMMAHAAVPSAIDQGNYGVCQIASGIENRLYYRAPSTVAAVVAAIAHSGTFSLAGDTGPNIVINDAHLLNMSHHPGDSPLLADGSRTFANQVFQFAAANALYQQFGNNYEYYGLQLSASGVWNEGRLDPESGALTVTHPKMSLADVVAANHLFEAPRLGSFIASDYSSPRGNDSIVSGPGRVASHAGTLTIGITDEQSLRRALETAVQRERFPVTVFLRSEPGSPVADSEVGAHMLNIVGYDQTTGTVDIDNTWGTAHDKKVSLSDLYYSITPFGFADQWRQDLAQMRQAGTLTFQSACDQLSRYPGGHLRDGYGAWFKAAAELAQGMTAPQERQAAAQRLFELTSQTPDQHAAQRVQALMKGGLLTPQMQEQARVRFEKAAASPAATPDHQLAMLRAAIALGSSSEQTISNWLGLAARVGFTSSSAELPMHKVDELQGTALWMWFSLQSLPAELKQTILNRLNGAPRPSVPFVSRESKPMPGR